MLTDESMPADRVTADSLLQMTRAELVDLLQQRTQLLVSSRMVPSPDQLHLKLLQKDVEIIQDTINLPGNKSRVVIAD